MNTRAPTSSLRPKAPGEEKALIAETEVPLPPSGNVGPEGVVIAAALLALLLFLFVKRKSSKHRSVLQAKVAPPRDSPKKPTRASPAINPWKNSETFDAASAEHARGHQVVCGKAYVTDGDTIVINKTQIRLFGIDAPELNHPYGQKAKWAMVKLCKGQKVRAEITETDAYGRTVARCYISDGRDLSAELVKQGLAIDWPKFSGGVYRKLEVPDARKKMWLADARQTGRMYLWEQFEYEQTHSKRKQRPI